MVELFQILISLILILVCGLFVAAEFSMLAVNRTTVERLAEKGDGRAKGVLFALQTLSTQLSSAQIGITITNLAIGFLAEPGIASLLETPLAKIGLTGTSVNVVSLGIALIGSTILTMIFGELVPKNLAIAKPLATAKFIQRPLLLFTAFARPSIKILNGSANIVLRRFGIEPQEELASARSADELLSLVRRSAEKGTLEKDTALMLERSLNFGDLRALDVMTPRVRIKALQADEPISRVLALAKQTGFSKFPVYGDDLDDIVGVIHIKQAFQVEKHTRETVPIKDRMRPATFVPSSIELEPLLTSLRKGGLQIAVAIDEFGGCDGIVTLEDLLEELVGEVEDEHDRSRLPIRQHKPNVWLVSGLLRPDEIGEDLGIYISEIDEVETLGGLMQHHLERIPSVGDAVTVDAVDRPGQNLRATLTVKRMDSNRVDRILLELAPLATEKEEPR